MADATTKANGKPNLTADERKARVQHARESRVETAFKGRKFEILEEISLGADQRFTDVTGNKARHGFKLKDTKSGEELLVGPGSLKKAAELYNAVKLPAKKTKADK